MSPISPSHPFASNVTPPTTNAKAQDPFLYTFPKFSLQNGTNHGRQSRPLHPPSLGSQRRFPFSVKTNHRHDDLSAPSAGAAVATGTFASTMSSTPLTPISPKRRSPVTALKSMRPSAHLHTSSPNASRRTVHSENDFWDEESASADSELDVTPLDFQKYLMHRIENRNPVHRRGRSVMSAIQR